MDRMAHGPQSKRLSLSRKSLPAPGLDPGQATWLCNVSFLVHICRLPLPQETGVPRRGCDEPCRSSDPSCTARMGLASALGMGRAL